ncbi:MAG: DUF3800 domain-containing protein [Deltaproteobacteria bacterium]
MLFRFYCDESYDGNAKEPSIITISGFFSDEQTWKEVEKVWKEINNRNGISCFHATDLNGARKEYKGWSKQKRDCYSSELLDCIKKMKKKMVAYNCGMYVNEYNIIINEDGRKKLGEPWFACFKTCIAMIAKHMETLPPDYRFSVFVEKGSRFDIQAIEFFKKLANNQLFEYRHRLETCISARPEEYVGLQVADLMAYEYFKRIKGKEDNVERRYPLKLIQDHNHYEEGFFGASTLKNMKNAIESAVCGPDELVIIPNLLGG